MKWKLNEGQKMTHMHITAWVIGIILFFVTYSMLKGANPKAKMLHMITQVVLSIDFPYWRHADH